MPRKANGRQTPEHGSEMGNAPTAKSIDFDQVADLYDVFVPVDADLEFWKQEARSSGGSVR